MIFSEPFRALVGVYAGGHRNPSLLVISEGDKNLARHSKGKNLPCIQLGLHPCLLQDLVLVFFSLLLLL